MPTTNKYITHMKKLSTLLLPLLLFPIGMAAQVDHTFEFVDENGNIIADGTTLTVNQMESDGFDIFMSVPVGVKATTETTDGGCVKVMADNLPNGTFQICSFGNCVMTSTPGTFYSAKGALRAIDNTTIAAEWMPLDYATWTVTLQLQTVEREYDDLTETYVYDKVKTDGPTITVHMVYADPTGIASVTSDSKQTAPVARYSLSGQRLTQPVKGINIVRRADGSTIKTIVK